MSGGVDTLVRKGSVMTIALDLDDHKMLSTHEVNSANPLVATEIQLPLETPESVLFEQLRDPALETRCWRNPIVAPCIEEFSQKRSAAKASPRETVLDPPK